MWSETETARETWRKRETSMKRGGRDTCLRVTWRNLEKFCKKKTTTTCNF